MAGSIGDMIFNLMGREDPRSKLLAAASAPPTGGTYAQPAATPAGTDAPQQQPVAQAYQSPPDLAKLYTEVLDRERSNQMIDRGIGLIGASLAFPENRPGIMAAFGGGGGSGTGSAASMLEQVMNVQKTNQAIQQMAATRAALPSIAQRYGLDMATAQYLLNSGKLDSVIAEAEKPNKQIVSNADGTSSIVDLTTGVIGEAFGPKKPRDIEIVTAQDGTKFAVYKDTGQRVGTDNIVEGEGSTDDIRELNRTNKERAEKGLPPIPTQEWIKTKGGTAAGKPLDAAGNVLPDPPKDMAWKRDANGNVEMNAQGQPVAIPISGSDLERERTQEDAAKSRQRQSRSIMQNLVNDKIAEAKKLAENEGGWLPTTGVLGGSSAAQLVYQPSADLAATLNTIAGNISLDKLNEMRQNAPSGASGLGQVTEGEHRILQSVYGSLAQSQSKEQFMRNLDRLEKTLDLIINVGIPTADNPAPTPGASTGGYKIIGVK
ncbi:hypothetical protein PQB35_gp38 [Ochrobactrum phage vB_OspP_OH]|uniref:Uncharacterized protein n=1 Tax=Ochrobactrum phage vB_OspP_OH TaxID=2712957 RepID=A0A6G6XXN7_9CAUD|nr:hypothetical protein PQB35_gp38 [Ochrobactrum phage vB_OspP_OH]QIG66094.1 hypothetical protein phiOH_p38 [Ochrobactrum phage vB_OspP_OH]